MRELKMDVTLRQILPSLDKPESFLRRVLGVMHEATKEHGPVVMRLGITGTGSAPNYRLENANNSEPILALDGANHKPWPEGTNYSTATNWSTAVMNKDEVASLLGELRGFNRK